MSYEDLVDYDYNYTDYPNLPTFDPNNINITTDTEGVGCPEHNLTFHSNLSFGIRAVIQLNTPENITQISNITITTVINVANKASMNQVTHIIQLGNPMIFSNSYDIHK